MKFCETDDTILQTVDPWLRQYKPAMPEYVAQHHHWVATGYPTLVYLTSLLGKIYLARSLPKINLGMS
jgi:hypothetical protein